MDKFVNATVMAMIHFHLKDETMIDKKRINKTDNYLVGIKESEEFFVGAQLDIISRSKSQEIGFTSNLENGEQALPKIIGPVSRFNANGSFIKLKELPMETRYREIAVKDWHGNYHYVDVPYQRYQRKMIDPPAIEIKIVLINNIKYFVSPLLVKNESNTPKIKHVINLFLELFGSCETLDASFKPTWFSIPTKKVNWQILPEGEYPWHRLSKIAGNIASSSAGKAKLQTHCVEAILKHKPAELIYGTGGFRGYLIFRFPKKKIFVMENLLYGNATYIFENNWEQFSQMTKAEIINNQLQKDRLEHRVGWEDRIRRLFI